jgi:fibronectin type 3 domain-containing protein
MRRAAIALAAVVASAMLAGCGYPGEPLPPALNRPVRVVDLNAVQQGSKILVHFTVPKLTTEGLPIPGTPEIEVRIGEPPAGPFNAAAWEKSSERIPATAITVNNQVASAMIDASKMTSKTEAVFARVLGPHGRNVGWSNPQQVTVVPPLATPEALTAANAPDAVRLEWHGAAAQFRVYRRSGDGGEWKQIAVADKPFYVDGSIDYGKTYEYTVQSIEKSGDNFAESEASKSFSFRPEDKYPPAVPSGLTAVAGSRNIELTWERNTEKDLAAYRVYRDGKKIADALIAPSYSDKDVKPGTKYSYQVSSVDGAGNESMLSAPMEAAIP